LPKEIGSLTSLSDFYAYNNNFSGRIPKEIWRMHSLRNLVLAENLISGQLPHEMSKMTNLGLFSCFRRSKDGPKLRGTLPSFDENPKLTDLYLDHNEIEGTIPTDFLASSSQAYLVNLASNELTGNVPPDLADLAPFQLELENNQISGFPMKLCDAKQWQQGDVGLYGCDAFMCKPGSYSKFGRQNTTDSACMECDLARYWGSTTCGGELPSSGGGALKSEYAILMELYLSCGGSKWANRDNWAHDDIDVCNWHGISCTDQGTVDSIRLGANNLVGTPPKSLFDLPDLEVLWLYSNPITFSFTNIGSALKLYELRLDSTNLKSVAGISSAQSLEILNLRFNKLRGSFPQEIMELKSLISLQIGDNDLDGTLPGSDQWGSMKTLEELRLGVNHFSGRIPDFKSNPLLSLLDLSWNAFSGEIPSNFLIKVPSGIPVQINLANNRLQGPVPEQFDRFDRLIIYLRGNQIETLPATLCDDDNGPWNKGDVSRYSCNGLLCPPGTYNELGRQHGDENPCLPCGEPSKFYGQTSCGGATSRASSSNKRVGWVLGMTKILASGLLALSSLVV
jgi:Leucine-rich repeat (LRR) protein